MRYYYDCPEEAILAMKYHGIKIEVYRENEKEFDYSSFYGADYGYNISVVSQKFYIHPESEKLLEPQVGDLIELYLTTSAGLPEGCSGIAAQLFILEESLDEYLENIGLDYAGHKIIQRAGKAFFTPIREE